MARDLQKLLEYTEWRNFLLVIEKAKTTCMNSGQNIPDHFVDVNKTIPMPKGAGKDIQDMMLTRYACYLRTNGSPSEQRRTENSTLFLLKRKFPKGDARSPQRLLISSAMTRRE